MDLLSYWKIEWLEFKISKFKIIIFLAVSIYDLIG